MKLRSFAAVLLIVLLSAPGCASASRDCTQEDTFCVGLVTEAGQVDDHGYNQAIWEGIQQAKASGAADWIASIETVDERDYEENIKTFVETGFDVVVTVGEAMGDVTRAAAQAYPDTYFIGLDQDQSESQDFNPNLSGLIFPEDQIGYLAGALAASLSQTGQIGAVCGNDASPAMLRYGGGFSAGAASVDPEVKATVIYHNEVSLDRSLDDPEWGAATANTLVDGGADIIFGVGGATGSNALVAAVTRGAYAIGADTDEYYTLPVAAPHLYASVLKMITPAIAQLIEAAKDAQSRQTAFPTGTFLGQVGLSSYHDTSSSVPEEVKAHMSELVQGFNAGEVHTGVTAP